MAGAGAARSRTGSEGSASLAPRRRAARVLLYLSGTISATWSRTARSSRRSSQWTGIIGLGAGGLRVRIDGNAGEAEQRFNRLQDVVLECVQRRKGRGRLPILRDPEKIDLNSIQVVRRARAYLRRHGKRHYAECFGNIERRMVCRRNEYSKLSIFDVLTRLIAFPAPWNIRRKGCVSERSGEKQNENQSFYRPFLESYRRRDDHLDGVGICCARAETRKFSSTLPPCEKSSVLERVAHDDLPGSDISTAVRLSARRPAPSRAS